MKELMNKMGVGNEEDKLNAKHKPDFFSFKDRHVIPATREAKQEESKSNLRLCNIVRFCLKQNPKVSVLEMGCRVSLCILGKLPQPPEKVRTL